MASDSKAKKLFDKFWEWRMKDGPEFASYCGNHEYDDLLDDISEEAYLQREKSVREFLAQAKSIDASSCSKSTGDHLTLFVDDLQLYLEGVAFKSYLLPVSYLDGIHNELHHLIGYHNFDTADGFEKYIKRLEALPNRITQAIPLMKQGIREGFTHHKHSVESVPKQLEEMVSGEPGDSLVIKPFNEKKDCLTPDVRDSLKEEAIVELTTNIRPSLVKLKDFIEKTYLKKTRDAEGVCTLKNGKEFYQKCLNFHLSCEMTPQKVHDMGLKEVARIRKQMLEICKKEGCGNDLKAFQTKLAKNTKFDFKSDEEVLNFVKDISLNKIRPKLTQVFHSLPDIPLVFKLIPPAQADAPMGFYSAGTFDKSRPGVYYLNANNLSSCKKYDFMSLSLHEGEPGHHLQQCFTPTKGVPKFRQWLEDSKYNLPPARFSMHTAYVEGWGLYSEALGVELGLYTDNYTLFGKYSAEMLRSARLVVDTGLHAMGWTQAKAVQYLVENTLSDEVVMRNEINRYITWPGQACAYKIGELKIWELRHKAEKALGSQFDVRDFHATVLQCGPVPLTFLEQSVNDYITLTKEKQASPAKKRRT